MPVMSDWAGKMRVLDVLVPPPRRITLKVTHQSRKGRLQVVADATGLVSHSGSALLVGLADRLGLTQALGDAMADTRERRSAHDPGAVLCDLAVMLADGGDSLSDLGALRDQPALFGAVASERTAWRTIGAVDRAGVDRSTLMKLRTVAKQGALDALAASRPGVRTPSWRRPGSRSSDWARRSRRWECA